MSELAFEYLAVALESTRGTAVSPPTHYLNMMGEVSPQEDVYRPNESRGTLAMHHRSKIVRRWSEWEGEGPLDVYTLPVLLNMIGKGGVTPTTPGGTDPRLWEFVPTMTSDDIKTGTIAWGDPNVQIFQGAYGTVDELSISSDASSTDGATMSASGHTQMQTQISAPTMPSMLDAPLISGLNMQLWLDTSSAIGSTEVTGRVVSAEHELSGGLSYKYLAAGTGADLSYTRIGRGKRSLTTTVVLELPDTTEYDIFEAGTDVKLRVRHNGANIETTYFHYVEVDTYGPLTDLSWGELEGTNRTVEFTVISQYDSTLGADWRIAVQNDRATL